MGLTQDEIVPALLNERTKLISLAWGMLRDVHAAEDVFQDLMVKALQPQRKFESVDHVLAWSWQVAKNRTRELLRRKKSHAATLDDNVLELLAEVARSRDAESITDQSEALAHCLTQLTSNAQKLIRLRYVDGMRAIDVAEKLGRQTNAVYVALSRTYRTLAECIERRIADAEGTS